MATDESNVVTQSHEAAQDLRTRLSDASQTAKTRTSQLASETATRAREVTSEVGHQIKEFGGRIRDKWPHERMRNTTHKVADTLEHTGTYLEQKNLDGMLEDLAGVIRRYPLQSLLAGVAIGFLLSRKRRDEY
jgi:hypothetical protein